MGQWFPWPSCLNVMFIHDHVIGKWQGDWGKPACSLYSFSFKFLDLIFFCRYWCISVSLKFCSVYSKWLQILEDRGLTLGLDCCIESPVSFHRKSCLRSWNLWCSKNNLTACVTGRGYSPEQGFQKCGGNEAEKRLTYFHMGQYTPDLYGQKQRASVMGPGPVCQHAWTCLWCPFLWLVMMLDLSLSGGVRTV